MTAREPYGAHCGNCDKDYTANVQSAICPHRQLHDPLEVEAERLRAKRIEKRRRNNERKTIMTGNQATKATEGNGIGWAVHQLHNGDAVQREGWNGPGQYLRLQVPDEHSANTLPYVYIILVSGDRVPWQPSQTDMLATDWRMRATD